MRKQDPVDDALQSLRSEPWSGITPDPNIEERLMNEYRRQHTSGGIRRYRSLVIALAVVLIGGVGFAATGGPEFVREFVYIRLIKITGDQVEGNVELNMVIEPDENGDGTAVATIGSVDGESTTITVQQATPEPTDDGALKTKITVGLDRNEPEDGTSSAASVPKLELTPRDPEDVGDTRRTVWITTDEDGAEALAPGDPDANAMIWDWVDDNGLDRELHLIPEASDLDGARYSVLTVIATDNHMRIYRKVGSFDFEGEVADVLDIIEHDGGALTLQLVDEYGDERTIELPGEAGDRSRESKPGLRIQRIYPTQPE